MRNLIPSTCMAPATSGSGWTFVPKCTPELVNALLSASSTPALQDGAWCSPDRP